MKRERKRTRNSLFLCIKTHLLFISSLFSSFFVKSSQFFYLSFSPTPSRSNSLTLLFSIFLNFPLPFFLTLSHFPLSLSLSLSASFYPSAFLSFHFSIFLSFFSLLQCFYFILVSISLAFYLSPPHSTSL